MIRKDLLGIVLFLGGLACLLFAGINFCKSLYDFYKEELFSDFLSSLFATGILIFVGSAIWAFVDIRAKVGRIENLLRRPSGRNENKRKEEEEQAESSGKSPN